ncbi:helix-turn-helix domain-containing protein [Ereboglobus luteus]|uniref:helix-turn-helix domain-containing protein n=1 Tax=Ereboglobus luteus TaxID=1796921 RepID=UPI001F354F7D|nr:helix-turn-helix domain-containing protein [Ereboglobus luteus]
METTIAYNHPSLIDINGLRFCGIFPAGREPSIRTLREWTRNRRIPHHRVGHFVYYDLAEVALHIRTKLFVPARG